MTRLAIIGGKLQGMEAAYLAKKAGIKTMVVDRKASAPALALADEAVVLDVVRERDKAIHALADCDAILPANEDLETLSALTAMQSDSDVPLIFDLNAYSISSSKTRSNDFMHKSCVPLPRPWPECGFPVVVKPSEASGSHGVTRAVNTEQLLAGMDMVREMGQEAVLQEFLDGPSISVEIISNGVEAVSLVTTEIILDDAYDCKMVGSPWEGEDVTVVEKLAEAGRRMAQELHLKGIMDVEAIVSQGVPRILEIDARIPSQTPTAVYHSHGINMIDMLVRNAVEDRLEEPTIGEPRFAYYEHVAVDDGIMRSCGEGSFAEVQGPRIVPGLFGSDEMITDYEPGKKRWRATIINVAANRRDAQAKRQKVIRSIIDKEGILAYYDPAPEGYT